MFKYFVLEKPEMLWIFQLKNFQIFVARKTGNRVTRSKYFYTLILILTNLFLD